mmetsp:Transcript_13616/g.27959  ORF Transcript_13616/g.27959 Transcript_13616/m.27959 type:complete len:543 (-) Transcript_13616:768-2396(-)
MDKVPPVLEAPLVQEHADRLPVHHLLRQRIAQALHHFRIKPLRPPVRQEDVVPVEEAADEVRRQHALEAPRELRMTHVLEPQTQPLLKLHRLPQPFGPVQQHQPAAPGVGVRQAAAALVHGEVAAEVLDALGECGAGLVEHGAEDHGALHQQVDAHAALVGEAHQAEVVLAVGEVRAVGGKVHVLHRALRRLLHLAHRLAQHPRKHPHREEAPRRHSFDRHLSHPLPLVHLLFHREHQEGRLRGRLERNVRLLGQKRRDVVAWVGRGRCAFAHNRNQEPENGHESLQLLVVRDVRPERLKEPLVEDALGLVELEERGVLPLSLDMLFEHVQPWVADQPGCRADEEAGGVEHDQVRQRRLVVVHDEPQPGQDARQVLHLLLQRQAPDRWEPVLARDVQELTELHGRPVVSLQLVEDRHPLQRHLGLDVVLLLHLALDAPHQLPRRRVLLALRVVDREEVQPARPCGHAPHQVRPRRMPSEPLDKARRDALVVLPAMHHVFVGADQQGLGPATAACILGVHENGIQPEAEKLQAPLHNGVGGGV